MQREIKFKAWNRHVGVWVDKLCLYLDDSEIGDVSEAYHNIENTDDYILVQYIGIEDIDGKPIYEGDIVEGECATYGKSIAVVGLDTYLGAYYTNIDYYPCEPFTHCLYMKQEHNKIIGNVFENPELLKNDSN